MSKTNVAAPPLDRRVLAIAGIVVLGAIMTGLDGTIVSVAIRTLGRDFNASLGTIQWVSTAYLLALASVIPITGWASSRFGTTRIWIISLVVFLAGSALCGAAWSATSLITFRVVQGVGGGLLLPVGMTIIAQAAGHERIGRVMALISVPLLLAPILGPALGGVLIDGLSWRAIFYINVPVALLAVYLSARVLDRDTPRRQERLDTRGLVLLVPGLALFVYGLSKLTSSSGLGSPQVLICGLGGLVLLAAFATHALRAAQPLLDLGMFRNRAFTASATINLLAGTAVIGIMLLLPLYYQVVRGESPLAAGLLTIPQGLGAALVQPIGGILVDRGRAGLVVLGGLVTMVIGYAAFTQLAAHTGFVLLSIALFVMGIGAGFTLGPAMSAGLGAVGPRAAGRASATINVSLRVGGSIGTALFAVVLQHEISQRLGGASSGGAATAAISPHAGAHLSGLLASAFASSFWWPMAIAAIGIPVALLLPRKRTQPAQAAEKVPSAAPAEEAA